MDCPQIRETLSAYIDGEVGTEENTMVEAHLRSCKGCEEFLSELKKSVAHVKSLDWVEPPVLLKEGVMAGAEGERKEKRRFLSWLFPQFLMPRPIHALATVLILLTTVYVFQAIKREATILRTPAENEGISTLSRKNEDMYYGRDMDRYRPLSEEPSSRKKEPPPPDDGSVSPRGGEYGVVISQEGGREERAKPLSEPEKRASSERVVHDAIERGEGVTVKLKKDEARRSGEEAVPAPAEVAPPRAAMRAKATDEPVAEAGLPAGNIRTVSFTITVKDLEASRVKVENVLRDFGIKGMSKETNGRGEALYRLSLSREALAELRGHLTQIGKVEEKADYGTGPAGENVEITIELSSPPSMPGSPGEQERRKLP